MERTVCTCLPTALFKLAAFHFEVHQMFIVSSLMTPESTSESIEVAINETDILQRVCITTIKEITVQYLLPEFNIYKLYTGNIRSGNHIPWRFHSDNRLNAFRATDQTETFLYCKWTQTIRRASRQEIFGTLRNLRIIIIISQKFRQIIIPTYRNRFGSRSRCTESSLIIRFVIFPRLTCIVNINRIQCILIQTSHFGTSLCFFLFSQITGYIR